MSLGINIITTITTTTITHTHSDQTSIQRTRRHNNRHSHGRRTIRLIIIRTIQIKDKRERRAVEVIQEAE